MPWTIPELKNHDAMQIAYGEVNYNNTFEDYTMVSLSCIFPLKYLSAVPANCGRPMCLMSCWKERPEI